MATLPLPTYVIHFPFTDRLRLVVVEAMVLGEGKPSAVPPAGDS